MKKSMGTKIVDYIIALIAVFFSTFPIIWLFLTSIKRSEAIYAWPPKFLPSNPTIKHYIEIFFGENNFLGYLINSTIVSVSVTIIVLSVGTLAAYAFARLEFKGKNTTMLIVLGLLMFPPLAVIPPLFLIFKKVGLVNNYLGLILGHSALFLPMTIWILTNYFQTLPKNIEDSAVIDGCSTLQMIWKILLPISLPGLVAAGLITFVFSWNEFLMSLVILSKNSMRTAVVGIALYPGEYALPWELISAATIIAIIPLMLLTVFFQKYIISGLTSGSIK
ncbi:MAG: carbohydrate ABC transporter permease [Bacillota bacterium]